MILLDNHNISNVQLVTTGYNILACKSLEEEHYDIYSINTDFGNILKESVSTKNGIPVVEFNVNYNGKLYKNVQFVVSKNVHTTVLNVNSLTENIQFEPLPITELVEIDEFQPLPVFESFDVIKEQLQLQKNQTINILQEENNKQLEYINQAVSTVIQEGLDKINKTIDYHKTTVISEINTAKNDNLEANYGEFLAEIELAKEKLVNLIEQTIVNKKPLLNEHAEKLTTDIKESFQKYVAESFSKYLDDNKKTLNSLKSITIDEINDNVKTLVENIKIDLDSALITAQSKYDKNVSLLDEKVENKLTNFQKNIDDIEEKLPKQITENVEENYTNSIKPLISNTIDNLKTELVDLIKDETSQSALFEQTKNAAIEKVTHIFTEAKSNNKTLEKTLKEYKDSVIKEIQDTTQQYTAKVLRRIEMSAGGGSVAKQYANGGTMNGSLNVNGQILSGGVDISTLFGTGSGGGGSDNIAVNTVVQTSSANWNSTYTTVNSNSSIWSLIAGGNTPGYYGSFYDTSTQTISINNAVSALSASNTLESYGVTLSSNSRYVFAHSGVYNIQFSMQLQNTSPNIHDAYVWLRYNGTDYPYTNGTITVPGAHGAGNGIDGTAIVAFNYVLTLSAGDYLQLMWSTTDAANISVATIAPTVPVSPVSPSLIFTATQVAVLTGFGNVTGPVSAVNNSIARFNGTTGTIITDGANSTIDNNGNAVFAGALSANGTITTTQYVNISSTTFTGITATATSSVTALNTFLQVIVNGSTKYLRLFDIT